MLKFLGFGKSNQKPTPKHPLPTSKPSRGSKFFRNPPLPKPLKSSQSNRTSQADKKANKTSSRSSSSNVVTNPVRNPPTRSKIGVRVSRDVENIPTNGNGHIGKVTIKQTRNGGAKPTNRGLGNPFSSGRVVLDASDNAVYVNVSSTSSSLRPRVSTTSSLTLPPPPGGSPQTQTQRLPSPLLSPLPSLGGASPPNSPDIKALRTRTPFLTPPRRLSVGGRESRISKGRRNSIEIANEVWSKMTKGEDEVETEVRVRQRVGAQAGDIVNFTRPSYIPPLPPPPSFSSAASPPWICR